MTTQETQTTDNQNQVISVIVPVYNVERYLRKCLDSIINQTYPHLEIILVNDGSTDSSGDICDEYAALDPRVKVFHKPNGGQSSARNHGLQYVTGDYIAYVDSDDWIDLELYQRCINKFKTNPQIDTIYFDFVSVYNEISNCPHILKETYEKEDFQKSKDSLLREYAWGGINPAPWNKIYKVDVIKVLDFLKVESMKMLRICLRHFFIPTAFACYSLGI